MQKNIFTAMMLLAVIVIWGYVGYQFFAGMQQDEEIDATEFEDIQALNPLKIDTQQSLKLNYSDPFLKSVNSRLNVQKATLTPKKIEKKSDLKTPEKTVNWPVISFKGLIKNQNHPEKLLGLILFNGKERIVRKGETLEDVLIVAIDRSKVEVQNGKEKRVFFK